MGKSIKHYFVDTVAEASGSGTPGGPVGPAEWSDEHRLYLDVPTAKTSNYTLTDGDIGGLILFNVASPGSATLTIPQAGVGTNARGDANFANGWFCFVKNIGTGALTFSPQVSSLNGPSGLQQGETIILFSNGANYYGFAAGLAGAMGFVPVQQGGGTGQGTNKIYIGWDSVAGCLRGQVDSTDLLEVYEKHKRPNLIYSDVGYVIDNGTVVITTGLKGWQPIDFAGTLMQATLLADVSGSIQIDVWRCTYAQYDAGATHPVAGDALGSISISSAVKAQDTTLTTWTKNVNAGDILAYNVASVTNIKRVTIGLKIEKK